MTAISPTSAAAPARVFFERVLLPYRSLPTRGFHVLIDGVFNHTGRDFWAFRDVIEKGTRYLYSQQRGSNWEVPSDRNQETGLTALAVYALVASGESQQDPPSRG